MPDNFQIEGLEFDIQADSKSAESSLDRLLAKLERLKAATNNAKFANLTASLERLNKSVESVSKSLSAVPTMQVFAESLEKLNNVKISPSLAKQLSSVAQAAESISTVALVNIKELGLALEKMDGIDAKIKFGTNGNTAKVTKNAVDSMAEKAKDSGMSEVTSKAEEAGESIEKVGEASSETMKKLAEMAKIDAFVQSKSSIDLLNMKLETLKQRLGKAMKDGNQGQITNLTGQIQRVSAAIDKAQSSVNKSNPVFDRFNIILGHMSFSNVVSFLKKIGSAFKTVGSVALKATKKVLDFVGKVTLVKTIGSKLASSVSTFTSKLGKLFSSLKRVAFYRLIRTAISAITNGFKESMQNLYQYSLVMGTDFAPNMDKIATSMLYLKNSLGAIAEPIIARLAPALDLLVDKFVDVLNVVNQVIATLNGSGTYTAAKKYATSWAEAADGTKKSLDEVKRYVLGFDELNILGKNKNDSSGTDGNALDYLQMFETRKISSGVQSFADTIKDAFKQKEFEKLGTQIGKWINKGLKKIPDFKIGVKIGTTINEINDFLYGLLDTVDTATLGSKVATNFNAAVQTIKWGNLGKTIGTGANKILDFFYNIIKTAKLGDLGAGIGDWFAAAVKTFKWGELGETVGIGFTKIAEFFGNLIEHASLGNLGSSISEFINRAVNSANWTTAGQNVAKGFNGIIDFFYNLITETSWKDAGSAVGEFLTNALDNIKWKELGATIAGTITGIADLFFGLFTGLDARTVGKAIGDTVKGFFNHLSSYLKNLNTRSLGKEVPLKIVEFLDGLDLSGILGSLGSFLWELIKKGFTFKIGLAEGILNLVIGTITGGKVDWDDIKNFGKKIGQKIWNGIKNVGLFDWIDDLKKGIDTMLKAIGLDPIFEDTSKAIAEGVAGAVMEAGKAILEIGLQNKQQGINGGYAAQDYALRNIAYNQAQDAAKKALALNGGLAQTEYAKLSADYDKLQQKAEQIKDIINRGLNPETVLNSSSLALTGIVTNITATEAAKNNLKKTVADQPLTGNVHTVQPFGQALGGLVSAVARQALTGNVHTVQTVGGAIGNFIASVSGQRLTGNVHTVSPTSSAWNGYYREVRDYKLTGTVNRLEIDLDRGAQIALRSAVTGAIAAGVRLASGGSVSHGHITTWNSIPKYAGGTANAHGSLFVAGEAGAEIVGNINGKTEILNRSQMAQAMYSAAVAGMSQAAQSINTRIAEGANAVIRAVTYGGYGGIGSADINGSFGESSGESMSALVDGVREGVYEATARQNDLLRQQNEILLDILEKDNTAEITTNSVVKALSAKNRRDGKYTVPVGVT